MKLPYFYAMSDAELRAAYWATREALASADKVATYAAGIGNRRGATRMAGHVFTNLRALDIIAGLARKRGISLAREVTP